MPPENSAGELIRTMVVMMSATASFARKAMLIKAKLSGRSGDSRSKQFECGQRSCMLQPPFAVSAVTKLRKHLSKNAAESGLKRGPQCKLASNEEKCNIQSDEHH